MLLCTPFSAPVSCLGSALAPRHWTYVMLWPSVVCNSYLGSWPSTSSLGHPEIESTDLPGFLFTWSCEGVTLLTALFPSIHFVFSQSLLPVSVSSADVLWGHLTLGVIPQWGAESGYCFDISWPNCWLQRALEVCLWTELRAWGIAVVIVSYWSSLKELSYIQKWETSY